MSRGFQTIVLAALASVCLIGGPSPVWASHNLAGGLASDEAFLPWGFNEWHIAGDDQTDLEIKQAGAIQTDAQSTARFKIRWSDIQPRDPLLGGQWFWGGADETYRRMRAQQMVPVLELSDAPAWARTVGGNLCPPPTCAAPPSSTRLPAWQEFVRRAVRRYTDVAAIEVWNEPNLRTYWYPTVNATEYAYLLRATYDAVRDTGSAAPVIVGGLTPGIPNPSDPLQSVPSVDFLRTIYREICACYFDGVGVHPYPHTLNWTQQPYDWVSGMWWEINRIDAEIRRNHDWVPLWITETGVRTSDDPSNAYAVSESSQGPRLHELYASLYGHGPGSPPHLPEIKTFIIHKLKDAQPNSNDFFASMGVTRSDNSLKPAYCYLALHMGDFPAACG